jgi:hypothetical protein
MTEQAKGERCACGGWSLLYAGDTIRIYNGPLAWWEHTDSRCGSPTPPPAPEPAKAKDCRCASVMDGRGGMCPAHPCEPAPGPAKGGESCHHTFNMAGVCVNCGYDAATLAADHRYCSPEIEAEWNALKKERDREKARADGLEAFIAELRETLGLGLYQGWGDTAIVEAFQKRLDVRTDRGRE